MDGVQSGHRRVQRRDRRATCAAPRTLFQDWAVAVYLDDEDSDLFDIKAVDFGDPAFTTAGRSTSPTTSSGTAAAATRARSRTPSGTSARTARRRPRCRSASQSRGSATRARPSRSTSTVTTPAQVAPHSGDTHWYGGYESQSDNVLDVDVDRRGGDIARLLDLALHRGGLGLRIRRGPGRRRMGHRAARRRRRHDGDHERRPARQQHRGQRPDRHVRRRVLRRRAGVRPPDRRSCRPARRTSGSATRPTRPTSTPAGSSTTCMVNGAAATVLVGRRASGSRPTGIQDNNWTVQVIVVVRPDPGRRLRVRDRRTTRATSSTGSTGDQISQGGFNTKCANGTKGDFVDPGLEPADG